MCNECIQPEIITNDENVSNRNLVQAIINVAEDTIQSRKNIAKKSKIPVARGLLNVKRKLTIGHVGILILYTVMIIREKELHVKML